MHVCMCVCVCMCVFAIGMCVCVCACTHSCVCVCVCAYMYVCVCAHACLCVHVCVYDMYVCVCMCVCVCVHACVCLQYIGVWICAYVCMLLSSKVTCSFLHSYSTEVFFTLQGSLVQKQLDWLVDDLRKANAQRDERPWIIAFGHRPMYCSTNDGDDCTKNSSLVRAG